MTIFRTFKFNRVQSLMLSNFLFVGTYSLLGSNALFLINDLSEVDKKWIVLGMSLFATMQIGGAWFLSFLGKTADLSVPVCFVLRAVGIFLLAFKQPWSICLGLLAFGLSHSIFYKVSRKELSDYLLSVPNSGSNAYLYFGLTTNLAFICLTGFGAALISRSLDVVIGVPMGLALLIFSVLLLNSGSDRKALDGRESSGSSEVSLDGKGNSLQVDSAWTLFLDILRFAAFLLPYAVLNSVIALKVQSAGLPSIYNAFLIGINSSIIIGLQLIGVRFQSPFRYSLPRYDLLSLAAVLLMIAGFWVNVWLLVPVVILYSICESYQMPNIEYLLFTVRKYKSTIINRFFLLDSLICFVGPWVGMLLVGSTSSTPFDESVQTIVNYLIHFYAQ